MSVWGANVWGPNVWGENVWGGLGAPSAGVLASIEITFTRPDIILSFTPATVALDFERPEIELELSLP